jgi:GT2 family glycosyltransferase
MNQEKLITISIVSSDDVNVLNRCLGLIFSETGKDISFEVYVVNNNSGLDTSNMVRAKYPQVKLTENDRRRGFSENHNQVIRASSGEYVLVMNPDIYVRQGFIENLLKCMESDKKTGIVMGKLLFGEAGSGKKTFDSAGGMIFRDRRTADRGQGLEDNGQYDSAEEVFYGSGSAMLCRREMLEDIKLFGEYFDGSFYLYKEELDLCWRARLRGWKVMYNPKAVAYHLRGWGKGKSRAKVPRFIRRHSYKNRYLMMLKDDHVINVLKDLPFILWHEVKALAYMIFREPHLFLAWPQIFRLLPFTLRKRREIMKRAVVGPDEIRKWFC